MKSLMLAGALFHTFSQAPQPYRENTQPTQEVSFSGLIEEYYNSGRVRNWKYIGSLGIYDVELYYAENNEASGNYGEANLLSLKITTQQNYAQLPSQALNISIDFDVIPEGTQQGTVAFHFIEGDEDYTNAIRTAKNWQEIDTVRREIVQEPSMYDINESRTFIGNDRNDVGVSINTVHQNEIYLVMWIDTELDMYRITADDIYISYEVIQPTQEIIDVPSLFWQILSMPFAFISQAFNLTIFPNTPYSLNVSNLLFTIIGGLIIIYIVRRFTR